jgi:hypothetical protein
MVAMRLSYHDLAARATETLDRSRLARAVEKLSAAYREGRSVDVHRTPEGRAAYLVHTLPAHVCDTRRLLLDELSEELRKEELRVLALGAGPGTEALAFAEAWAALGEEETAPRRRLTVSRVDQVGAWDEAFAAMRAVFEPALAVIDPTFGESWTWEVPPTVACDLARDVPGRVLELAASAHIIIVANLVSEILPRGTPALAPGFIEGFKAIGKSAPAGSLAVLLDRGHAPGVKERLVAAAGALASGRAAVVTELREREVRCACALTKATVALYKKVRLPTTKVEDRPIGNTRTAWLAVRFG